MRSPFKCNLMCVDLLFIDYFAKISLSSNFQRQGPLYKNLQQTSNNLAMALPQLINNHKNVTLESTIFILVI